MPLFLLFAAGLWWFVAERKQAPGKVKVTVGPAKLLPTYAVDVGTASLSQAQAQSVPLAVRTPAQDALVIAAAAKDAGVTLPNLTTARANAQSIADLVRTQGVKYPPSKVQAWQMMAGTRSHTGAYDAETARALKSLGAKNVPQKFYRRSTTAPYGAKAV